MGFFDKAKQALKESVQEGQQNVKSSIQSQTELINKTTQSSTSRLSNKLEAIQEQANEAAARQQNEVDEIRLKKATAKVDRDVLPDIDKERVIGKAPVYFQNNYSKKLVGATIITPKIYQLDDSTVTFSLSHAILFELISMSFAGPVYHEETIQKELSPATKTTVKKKHHGIAGTVIGTVLAPGVGTIAGAVVGSHTGKDKITDGHAAKVSTSTKQVEDGAPLTLELRRLDNDEHITLVLAARTKDYDRIRSEIKVPEVKDDNDEHSESISDEAVNQLKKIKDLLDSGILTQEEFDTKKKQILNL